MHQMLPKILALILLLKLVSSSNGEFIFNGFSGSNLSLNGLAEITSGGLLTLTNDTKEGLGHAFYTVPLHSKNSSDGKARSFSTTFVFAIVPQYPDVTGHGIAFALSPTKELSGAIPSNYLGLFNTTDNGNSTNHMFAVELDTVKSMEFADINDNHIGLDVNGLRSMNSSAVAYFEPTSHSFKSLKLISGNPMQVWVTYNGPDMRLDVTIAPLDVPKPDLPLMSSELDLSSVVSDVMYVGFSASTGAAAAFQYILGWSFSLNGSAQPLDLSKLPLLPDPHAKKERSQVLTISLSVVAVILFLISIGIILFVQRRRRRRRKFAELLEDWELEYGPQRFRYRDLFMATKGFAEEHLLGAGGFGQVYRGVLPTSGAEVAVKKISHESRQGMREFIAEVASMGRLRHRNLVQLLGYCRRRGELLLVYDYMPNGSLDKFLFEGKQPVLCWSQRFRIIKGVASGLAYLHDGWEQVVIHRDIKASNVLLDGEFNGKLGDFGLARLYDHGTNPETTRMVGTFGYLAPELSKTGKATKSTDVYAFGAFLLEVACGRRPLELRSSAEVQGLVDWVLECWKKGIMLETGDPKLGSDFEVKEMESVLKLGLLCSHPDPTARPSMRQVIHFLEGDPLVPAMPLDSLITSFSAQGYDESFNEFIVSYPYTSNSTCEIYSSPPVSGRS